MHGAVSRRQGSPTTEAGASWGTWRRTSTTSAAPVTTSTRDGLRVKSFAIGLETRLDLGQGWTLEDRFRRSSNSGRFMALFPADNGNNGSNAFFTGTLFNTSLDDLGNTFNDLKLSRKFGLAGGSVNDIFNNIKDRLASAA